MSEAKFKVELTAKIYAAIREFEINTGAEVKLVKIQRDALGTISGEIMERSVITGIEYEMK